jgi:hypothetical protein
MAPVRAARQTLQLCLPRDQDGIHAILPGEPQHAVTVEGRRVEIGIAPINGQWITLHFFRGRIDTYDGIQAAVGDPWRAIGSDDHTMRRRSRSQRDMMCLAGLWIEAAQRARRLRGVPHRAIRRGRNIVRM